MIGLYLKFSSVGNPFSIVQGQHIFGMSPSNSSFNCFEETLLWWDTVTVIYIHNLKCHFLRVNCIKYSSQHCYIIYTGRVQTQIFIGKFVCLDITFHLDIKLTSLHHPCIWVSDLLDQSWVRILLLNDFIPRTKKS